MRQRVIIGFAAAGFLLSLSAHAQLAIPAETRSQIAMDRIANGAASNVNIVYGVSAPPGEVIGDVYLDPAWNMGTVMLESGALIERYNMRYDLKSQMLEIQTFTDVRVLYNKLLKTIVWRDPVKTRYFVNAMSYKRDGEKLAGLLEVLVDGTKPLFRHTTMHVKRPDYVPALDVGSRDATIYKKTAVLHGVGSDLIEVKGKKDVLAALSDKGPEVEAIIKAHGLNPKKEEDVVAIFVYYNKLTESKSTP